MTEIDPPAVKRLKLNRKELEEMSKEEIVEHWLQQDQYVDVLEARNNEVIKDSMELMGLRESEDKLRQQQLEATRRENLLVMRLAAKEQEMQECASQIQDLKQAQTPGSTQLRSTLLDPAVNLMFESMKKELNSTKAKLEETQNELSAWKFTPDSNTGKRLMAKCRSLYQENDELGKMISTGRIAKLEGDLALHKNFSEEMKKSQTELDEFLLELDEDVEAMQSTILYLQQQLRESKEQASKFHSEIQRIQMDQVRSSVESENSSISYAERIPSIPFEITDKFAVPLSVTNHVKSNGDINGSVVANGNVIGSSVLQANSGDYVSQAEGNKNSCYNLNLNAHSTVNHDRTSSVNCSTSNVVKQLDTDNDDWPKIDNILMLGDAKSPAMIELTISNDNLTIEEQLQAMEECDSTDSVQTSPNSLPLKETTNTVDKEKSSANNVERNDHLTKEKELVNGIVDGISSVSDDDL